MPFPTQGRVDVTFGGTKFECFFDETRNPSVYLRFLTSFFNARKWHPHGPGRVDVTFHFFFTLLPTGPHGCRSGRETRNPRAYRNLRAGVSRICAVCKSPKP